jgi:hypothetical protein
VRLPIGLTRSARLATIVASAALLLLPGSGVSAATRTPWNTNLIKNPGAQSGPASSDGYQVVGIPRWVAHNNFTVVRYGELDFPTVAEGQRIGGGTQFFAAGLATGSGECGLVQQWIQIKGRNAAIDAGRVRITIGGYVASYGNQVDPALIEAVMATSYDPMAGFAALATDEVWGTNSVFRKVQASRILPAGTRWIKFGLVGVSHEGGYCDAYFDKISMKLRLV